MLTPEDIKVGAIIKHIDVNKFHYTDHTLILKICTIGTDSFTYYALSCLSSRKFIYYKVCSMFKNWNIIA